MKQDGSVCEQMPRQWHLLMGVASARPFANHLHLTPDRLPCQHLINQFLALSFLLFIFLFFLSIFYKVLALESIKGSNASSIMSLVSKEVTRTINLSENDRSHCSGTTQTVKGSSAGRGESSDVCEK